MRELPALFRTEMVRAILGDRKWKTRRLVKLKDREGHHWEHLIHRVGDLDNSGRICPVTCQTQFGEISGFIKSQWQKGDHLWVRETWCNINKPEFEPEIYYKADIDPLLEEDYSLTHQKRKELMENKCLKISLNVES